MGFPRQEYWSGLPFPYPGDLPNPGIEPTSRLLHWQAVSLPLAPPGKPNLELFHLPGELNFLYLCSDSVNAVCFYLFVVTFIYYSYILVSVYLSILDISLASHFDTQDHRKLRIV